MLDAVPSSSLLCTRLTCTLTWVGICVWLCYADLCLTHRTASRNESSTLLFDSVTTWKEHQALPFLNESQHTPELGNNFRLHNQREGRGHEDVKVASFARQLCTVASCFSFPQIWDRSRRATAEERKDLAQVSQATRGLSGWTSGAFSTG